MPNMDELNKDIEEVKKLLSEATRQRVKDVLVGFKAEIEREIVTLELKAKQAEQRKNDSPRRYTVDLKEYAWDQSDKFVKIFANLADLQENENDRVKITFSTNSLNLLISDGEKDHQLIINNLLHPIIIEKSYHKVKKGMVAIYMKKEKESQWAHLTRVEYNLKKKEENDMKPENTEDALMNIMKKMYNQGDSKTKQMIAKAWTENQEKLGRGDGGEPPLMDLPN